MKNIDELLDLLRNTNKTVSTAESITAGNLQRMLASVSGASDVFTGGITAYKLPVKVQLLGVDEIQASATNCVDSKVAEQMALGALKLFKTDYAIATCGYAEPYPTEQITEPFAFISIASSDIGILSSERVTLSGNRTEAQQMAAQIALELFRDKLC